MLLRIPAILDSTQLAELRARLRTATWADGKLTAGHQSARRKSNEQLPEEGHDARELGDMVAAALGRHPLFFSAALPQRVFPPLFNRYHGGQAFGEHVDGAIRVHRPTGQRIRADLSATLFLSAPDDYDGGELVIEHAYGSEAVKLPAGDMVLYPATSLHRVKPVTRGERLASFLWIQSMVRDDGQRSLMFDLDMAIMRLSREHAEHPSLVPLTGVYHNLLRMWAEP